MRRTLSRRTPEAHTPAPFAPSASDSRDSCPSCGCRCAPPPSPYRVARRHARLAASHDPYADDIRGKLHFALRLTAGLLILWARRLAPGLGLIAARKALPSVVGLAALFGKGALKAVLALEAAVLAPWLLLIIAGLTLVRLRRARAAAAEA